MRDYFSYLHNLLLEFSSFHIVVSDDHPSSDVLNSSIVVSGRPRQQLVYMVTCHCCPRERRRPAIMRSFLGEVLGITCSFNWHFRSFGVASEYSICSCIHKDHNQTPKRCDHQPCRCFTELAKALSQEPTSCTNSFHRDAVFFSLSFPIFSGQHHIDSQWQQCS